MINTPKAEKRTRAAPATVVRESRLCMWGEKLGLIALAGLTLFFVATSWRKWPDPVIDFGRELYLPWRLAHGAVLYRDVEDYYGPLSQYWNAGLFRLFGPGLMILVTANLVVFAAILATIYSLFRRAWGAGAALASSAVFVSVFGFSQYLEVGNYNYATPYSHETTHGLLICLVLVVVLLRWVEESTFFRCSLAGGLLGLTVVLKPEILLAAGLVTVAAVAVRLRYRRPIHARSVAAWAASAALPTLGFALYFSAYLPFQAALAAACRAWLDIDKNFGGDVLQAAFLGFDRPWERFVQQAGATVRASAAIAGIAAAAWLVDRSNRKLVRLPLCGILAAGVAWLAWFRIAWLDVGHCLLGLALMYLAVSVVSAVRGSGEGNVGVRTARLLVAVLAAALMARMLLNGRIYQFGFYQAALAGLLVPAVMIGELPVRLRMGRWGRAMVIMGALLLLAPGVVRLAGRSQDLLRLKTQAVGEGVDRFYAFRPESAPAGKIVQTVSDWLRRMPSGQTLLVLPEGVMVNYLARMPSPVSPFYFFSAATRDGREQAIVSELERRPPDWVAIVSRDLREYGIRRYGESPGSGRLIVRWVADNYEPAMSVGGDPFDPLQRGAFVLRRKPAAARLFDRR